MMNADTISASIEHTRSLLPVGTIVLLRGTRPQPPAGYIEQGISNGGDRPDFVGVVFPDGRVSVRWQTEYCSTVDWDSLADFLHVHGHPDYGTELSFQFVGPDGGVIRPEQLLTRPVPFPFNIPVSFSMQAGYL